MASRLTLTQWIIRINIIVAVVTNLILFTSGGNWPMEMLGFTLSGFLSGAIWQPFTYMWMHAPFIGVGVLHIVFNMLTLHFVGKVVETHLGPVELAKIYFPGGLISVLVFALEVGIRQATGGVSWQDQVPLVGASGALCAVIGVFTTLFPNTKVFVLFLPIPLRARTVLYGFILFSLAAIVLGWADFVAHSAHLGGIFYGMLYSRWMTRTRSAPNYDSAFRRVSPQQMAIWEVQSMNDQELIEEMELIREKIGHLGIRSLDFRERLILDRARSRFQG